MPAAPQHCIWIVAGGTGGHLYPGIAVARELSRAAHVRFIVRRGDLGKAILSREHFDVVEITGQGMPRNLSIKLLSFPFSVLRGFLDTARLIRKERPSMVVGMGGYLSFPVLLVAKCRGIPTLIHEQNVYPGLANRLLGRWVDSVSISFASSSRYFPAKRVWHAGLPIRSEIGTVEKVGARKRLGLDESRWTLLVFGGSLGAHHLNEIVMETWSRVSDWRDSIQVLHITGPKDYEALAARYRELPFKSVVLPYVHMMQDAYAASDVVVCRAGASTITELSSVGRPAVLIPYPYASNQHQLFNARLLEEEGAAVVIEESQLTAERLETCIRRWKEKTSLHEIGESPKLPNGLFLKDAAHRLSNYILQHVA